MRESVSGKMLFIRNMLSLGCDHSLCLVDIVQDSIARWIKRSLPIALSLFPLCLVAQIKILCDQSNESIQYGINLWQAKPITLSFTSLSRDLHLDLIILRPEDLSEFHSSDIGSTDFQSIQPQGYRFKKNELNKTLYLLYRDEAGLLYGLQDIREALFKGHSLSGIQNGLFNPFLPYRIIKYNLPWSPYRNSAATALHDTTCRDLHYWEKFLDMMVQDRLNVLSLWNIHPFPFMIQSRSFPMANDFNASQMNTWRSFWSSLFHMAKVRGIETFIVNWNIAVSPQFAKNYHVAEYNDPSEIVKQYTRESVTQVINEYPELTGIGVTLADWMGTFDASMSPQQREDWIEETMIKGMQAADRPVKFLHRSVLAGDPLAMRHLIDRAQLNDPALVEIKFNWSHGHSTPTLAITHDYHSGKLDERFWSPKPSNYDIQWMMRNEDFFILRWGQPDFIRDHIRKNVHDYVNGYFIGSEGYIPAVDYSSKELPEKTWQYAFEKQWLFYSLWGRLLYDPTTPDAYFESLMDYRYGPGAGYPLLKAYKLSSKMPLRLASFHRSTWDYTLYSEGFIEAEPSNTSGFFDRSSPMISIDEFIQHETLDPDMLSIPDFVAKTIAKEKIADHFTTPLELAALSEQDSRQALKLYSSWITKNKNQTSTLSSEWKDIAAWSCLGLYLADKLKAGVALQTFYQTGNLKAKQESIRLLKIALIHWDQVILLTKDRYKPSPHVALSKYQTSFPLFSWIGLRDQVVRDIELAHKASHTLLPLDH